MAIDTHGDRGFAEWFRDPETFAWYTCLSFDQDVLFQLFEPEVWLPNMEAPTKSEVISRYEKEEMVEAQWGRWRVPDATCS